MFVESEKQLHEVVNVHHSRSLLLELDAGQYLINKILDVEVLRYWCVVLAAVDIVVLLHHQQHSCDWSMLRDDGL